MKSSILPEEIISVMKNGFPAVITTCSAEGVPNSTIISQVYYVDQQNIALSFQFFSKTTRNIRANPNACVYLIDLQGYCNWIINVTFDHSESEGAIFDEMDMQIEAIASMTGMSGIFKLKASHFYLVKSVEKIPYLPIS